MENQPSTLARLVLHTVIFVLHLPNSFVKLLNYNGPSLQVFVLDTAGGNECVAVEPERPSYKRLQEILKSRIGSKAGQGWFDRLLGEFKFNQESLKNDDN